MSDIFYVIGTIALITVGVMSCQNTEFYKEYKKEQAQYEQQQETPHVIREADGCKVYAFKANDKMHYFTRCPDSKTSTETNHEECHKEGKFNKCKIVSEIIENN